VETHIRLLPVRARAGCVRAVRSGDQGISSPAEHWPDVVWRPRIDPI